MYRIVLTISLALLPTLAHARPARPTAPTLTVCVAASGQVTARSRCRAGESPLNLQALVGPRGEAGPQGPAGPQGVQGPRGGLDLSTCYHKQAAFNSALGLLLGRVECADKAADFMLSDGVTASTGLAHVNEREVVKDGAVPVGVKYWLVRPDLQNYTAAVAVTCCKR